MTEQNTEAQNEVQNEVQNEAEIIQFPITDRVRYINQVVADVVEATSSEFNFSRAERRKAEKIARQQLNFHVTQAKWREFLEDDYDAQAELAVQIIGSAIQGCEEAGRRR